MATPARQRHQEFVQPDQTLPLSSLHSMLQWAFQNQEDVPPTMSWLRITWALVESLRPKQWTKNAFLFTAVVFDRKLTYWPAFWRTVEGFLLFCLLSGAVYLLNDILDREADRQHPRKRHRPIASGRLPLPVAWTATFLLPLILLPTAWLIDPAFGLVTLAYYGLMLAYSFILKHLPLVDVFTIAAGFVLRVAAGAQLVRVERFSPWLYVVTVMLALFIALGKRRAEIALLQGQAHAHRRVLGGYTLPFLDQLITISSTATIMAYSLYTFSAPNLPQNHVMMLTIPFVLYGIFRYLYLVYVQNLGGAPEEALLQDRPLQLTVLLWGLSVLLIFYIF